MCIDGMPHISNVRENGKKSGKEIPPKFDTVIFLLVYSQRYRELKDEWWGVPEVFDRQDIIEVTLIFVHSASFADSQFRRDIV